MTQIKDRKYLATFVLDSREITDSVDSVVSQITEVVEKAEGEVQKVENKGTQQFARTPDKGLSAGVYLQMEFVSGAKGPEKIKESLRLEKVVNRILIQSI